MSPAQLILYPPAVLADRVGKIPSFPGSVMLIISVAVQKLLSIIFNVYIPVFRLEISWVVPMNPFVLVHVYAYGANPLNGVTLMNPSDCPKQLMFPHCNPTELWNN